MGFFPVLNLVYLILNLLRLAAQGSEHIPLISGFSCWVCRQIADDRITVVSSPFVPFAEIHSGRRIQVAVDHYLVAVPDCILTVDCELDDSLVLPDHADDNWQLFCDPYSAGFRRMDKRPIVGIATSQTGF